MERLKRTQQCAKCPWKTSTNPYDIPRGYSREKHLALKSTIADATSPIQPETMRYMACHEHDSSEGVPCVGWLANQLGRGNNIALRIAMLKCENAHEIKLSGPQHETFDETLPPPRKFARPASRRRKG